MNRKKVVRLCFALLSAIVLCTVGCSLTSSEEQVEKADEYYRMGVASNHSGNYEEAAYYLKQAEDCLSDFHKQYKARDDSVMLRCERLAGLVWFYLGNTYESEMLYNIAQEYYRKALPLLKNGDNTVYLACACRDIARTMAIGGAECDSVLPYFDMAEYYARQAGNELLLRDITAYRYQLCYPDSVMRRLEVCRDLAANFGAPARYSEIVELFLEQRSTDSAAFYLERLHPADSSYVYWFEQTYTYLQSKVLCQFGRTEEAYGLLLDLYDRKIDELKRDAGARTYSLALHYDVEHERMKADEAQRQRQWQRTVSFILVLVLGLVVALLFVLWLYWHHRRREQATALQALQDKYSHQLRVALDRLKQKVNLTREMELQRLRGNEPEFPRWLQTYRDEQLTLNKESINELIASVDRALDGAVSRLRKDYPALTESDMQFAILSIIGASDSDKGILLNVRKQTIYHRRQIIRKHVNPAIEDIDSWLREYVLNQQE